MADYTFEPVDDEHVRNLIEHAAGENKKEGRVIIKPSNCLLNPEFKNIYQKILDFTVYPDDVWVVTFPKCGTTWTQEMVWLLINNLNYEESTTKQLKDRSPFLEFEAILSMLDFGALPSTMEQANNLARPRTIKSHLPKELLPRQLWTVKPKIVYVARDPKDVSISFYHHHRLFNGFYGPFEEFLNAFLAERVIYSPYWSHILEFWKMKDEPNILFNTYEEMKRDLAGVVTRTAKFLGRELTEEQLKKLLHHLSFESMKDNKAVNADEISTILKQKHKVQEDLRFIRSGKAGVWKTDMTPEMIERFDKWNKEKLQGTEFTSYPWS